MDTVLFKYLWDKGANFLSKFQQQEDEAPVRPVNVGPNEDSIDAMHLASGKATNLYQHFKDPNLDVDICETEDAIQIVQLDGIPNVIKTQRGIMIVFTAKDDFKGSVLSQSFAEHIAAPGNLSAAEMRNHFETAMNNHRTWAEALSDNKRKESGPRRGW